jgi:hypothetical protein
MALSELQKDMNPDIVAEIVFDDEIDIVVEEVEAKMKDLVVYDTADKGDVGEDLEIEMQYDHPKEKHKDSKRVKGKAKRKYVLREQKVAAESVRDGFQVPQEEDLWGNDDRVLEINDAQERGVVPRGTKRKEAKRMQRLRKFLDLDSKW